MDLSEKVKDWEVRGSTDKRDIEAAYKFFAATPLRSPTPLFNEHERRIELAKQVHDRLEQLNVPNAVYNPALWAALFVAPVGHIESMLQSLKHQVTPLLLVGINTTCTSLPILCKHCKSSFVLPKLATNSIRSREVLE